MTINTVKRLFKRDANSSYLEAVKKLEYPGLFRMKQVLAFPVKANLLKVREYDRVNEINLDILEIYAHLNLINPTETAQQPLILCQNQSEEYQIYFTHGKSSGISLRIAAINSEPASAASRTTANILKEYRDISELKAEIAELVNSVYHYILATLDQSFNGNIFLDEQLDFDEVLINYFKQNPARLDLERIRCQGPKFEEVFHTATKMSLLTFLARINGDNQIVFNEQSFYEDNKSFFPDLKEVHKDNSSIRLVQKMRFEQSLAERDDDTLNQGTNLATIDVTTEIRGQKTYVSSEEYFRYHKFPQTFDFYGINHNKLIMTIGIHGRELAKPKIINYIIDTIGSYRNHTDENAVTDAVNLLTKIQAEYNFDSKKPVIFLDFKPLKRLCWPDHDAEILDNHIQVMSNAIKIINSTGNSQAAEELSPKFSYYAIWGNSHFLPSVGQVPQQNRFFKRVIDEIIRSYNQEEHNELKLVYDRLITLTQDIENFRKRGSFRLIFSLTRILAARNSNVIILGGCAQAKDRIRALSYASEIIIQSYHIFGDLDFIDDNGRLKKKIIDENESYRKFLEAHINNVVGYNFFSYTGIGRLNNKNLDILAGIFKGTGLFSLFNQTPLIKTPA